MYTARQKAAMKKMTPNRRKAFKAMLDSTPGGFRRNPASAAQLRNRERQIELEQQRKKRSAAAKRAAAKRKAAPKRKAAAPKRKGKRTKASYVAAAKKAAATRRRNARKAAPKKTAARRKPRTYGKGKYRALKARYGPVSRHTYMYKTKKGRARHIPSHAILGYPSVAALRAAWDDGEGRDAPRIAERTERLARRRDKASQTAARRVRRGLGIFTPNSGEILSFKDWKEMKPNAARKKKSTKASRSAAAKKAAATRKRNARRRSAAAKKAAATRRRRGKKTAPKRKGKRSKASYRAAAKKAAATRRRNARKGGRKTTTRKSRRRSITVRPRSAVRISYAANRRKRRSYKRNISDMYMTELKGALKLGALVTVGYVGHRALTKVINDKLLVKVKYFTENTTGMKYRDLFAGAVTALGLIPLVMFAGQKAKIKPVPLAAGVAASLIHGSIVKLLGYSDNATVQKYAPYLNAYPNAEGQAYGSYYEFSPHQVYNGAGAYYELPQATSGFGQLTQAAAGYGASPMLTQAAAGYGASPMLTQAAAGTGEYVAYGVDGIGEYEEVATSSRPMSVDEGIYPNTHTAEQAMSIAEAAAGVGSADVPLQSTVNPMSYVDPIGDLPGGSRAGVFQGGDGIFG